MAANAPDQDRRGNALPEYLNRWVARQRWYAGKGRTPLLRSIGHWVLPTSDPGVSIRTDLVLDTAATVPVLYQLPLTERSSALPGGDPAALVATITDTPDTTRYVYDAPHDPAYARALLRFILGRGSSPASADATASAHGAPLSEGAPGEAGHEVTSSHVLSGEQSNTSIILETVDVDGDPGPGRPVICKVFRVLHHGENPDVAVQSALAGAGSRFVPEPVGCVVGEWDDPGQPHGRATGHLVFAQEFLPGVQDAWREAVRAAETGTDFTEPARKLGEATADVHADLATVMPTGEATPMLIENMVNGMRSRYRQAVREVPALADHGLAVEAIFARAQSALWPRLQRIHGDYHLGQVLDAPGRGWVLLDFEGEPLRPLHERTQLDIALRDVAGMLRSFSYVLGTVMIGKPERPLGPVTEWTFACRRAFLEGYADRSGQDLSGQAALLDAFELDKAIYETVYETRNRPAWLPIPLMAVLRLVAPLPSSVSD